MKSSQSESLRFDCCGKEDGVGTEKGVVNGVTCAITTKNRFFVEAFEIALYRKRMRGLELKERED